MKWIFITLFLATACANSEKTPAPKEDHKSPYTVQNCLCMKIFEPVCADGREYGNSCEAECHGHKTWTKGSCKQAPKKK